MPDPLIQEGEKHLGESLAAGLLTEFREGSFVTETAAVQQPEPIAQSFCFVETVRRNDPGFAFSSQQIDVVENHSAADDIESSRRLVEQHDRRIMNDRASEVDPLLLTRAECRASPIEKRTEIENGCQLLGAGPHFGWRYRIEIR